MKHSMLKEPISLIFLSAIKTKQNKKKNPLGTTVLSFRILLQAVV